LAPGDYVVFVCGKQPLQRRWEYFFTGVATLSRPLTREQIWNDDTLAVYRTFLNVLARASPSGLKQYESIRPFHDDWRNRCTAPTGSSIRR